MDKPMSQTAMICIIVAINVVVACLFLKHTIYRPNYIDKIAREIKGNSIKKCIIPKNCIMIEDRERAYACIEDTVYCE